jgi:hypothetical protein
MGGGGSSHDLRLKKRGRKKANKRSMREWMKKRGRRKGGEEYDYCEGEEEEEEGEL